MVYEQEKQRATHLLILMVCTILIFVLTGESILLGWDKGAIALLLTGLVASWGIHVTEKIPEELRLWLYFILSMLAFFFYGIHETSIYDLAPVMIAVIILYSSTERYSIIRLCVATYFLTMGYDFVFVLGTTVEISPLVVTRTLLHLMVVYLSGYMTKVGIRRRNKERTMTKEQIDKLEETNHRIEDFLTNVSHELRTPINAVTGITSVMLKSEDNPEKRKDLFAIHTAGQRLFGQVEDILDYTEIDTGRIQVSQDSYMITSLVNDIIASNRVKKREKNPELIFDVDAAIPSVLIGDERKIKKILEHLIDNSYKFTSQGAIYVRLYALRKEYGINLMIQVSDTGIGIPEEELERIRDKFYQANGGRNRRAGGLGLGLPIVYGLVSAMEGFVQISSTPKEGTTVSVSIPQRVAEESPCMVLQNRAKLCLACYLRPETYDIPEVRDYYNMAITHMVQGLEMPLHRVFCMEELEKLTSMYQLTHLFLSKEEYEENISYYESMVPGIRVGVVVDDDYVLPKNSRVKLLKKPLYSLPIVNMINAQEDDQELLKEKTMICPGIRVLVVDDEPMNLMVAEGILKNYQMLVTTAESGRKAIELCEREEFELIFLDHMMPEMDGVETLKQLRKIYANTGRIPTVIAFTANAVSGAREMFMRVGFDAFVSKPIERIELERILRKVLPKSSFLYVDEDTITPIQEEKQETTGEDKFKQLEKAGIHTGSGIQYSGGDRAFYVELLMKFAQDERKKETEISSSFNKADWQNYQILVHALKSTAKMVGADLLSEEAKEMETAAKNQDAAYISEHHDALLARYHQVAESIRKILQLKEEESPQADTKESAEISKDELLLRLEQLKEGLDTFEEEKAQASIAELGNMVYEGTLVEELLADVLRDVEDFEFTSAAGKVEAFIRKVRGGEAE